jgi:hypothetical protein
VRILFVNHTGLASGAEHSLLALIDGMPSEMVAWLACPAGPLAEMRASGASTFTSFAGPPGACDCTRGTRRWPWRCGKTMIIELCAR